MAIEPPPGPTIAQQAPPPTVPKQRGCFGRGCGCGCGAGCLLAIVLAVLLVVGGVYFFFVVQAQASVSAPAALLVHNQPLDAGSTAHTGEGGHAAIQFPDGSFVRMSPDTSVKLTAARLQNNGNLQEASVLQSVGRTFSSVQHLVSGASFQVGGHSV